MDQIIAVFGIDWKVLIVQIVNFSLLLGVLWYFLYTPFTKLIESRRAQIIKGVADAERAEAALKDADAKKSEIMTKASLEAEHLLMTAREHANAKEVILMNEAYERYERTLAEAKQKGEEIKREALVKSREQIAQLIVLGAEKALRARITR